MVKQIDNTDKPGTERSVRLKLKVVPGASRSEVSGWLGDALKIRVSAPPEKGKANTAVEALLCQVLNLPAGAARVVSGSSSQRKIIEIHGLSISEIRQRLGTL